MSDNAKRPGRPVDPKSSQSLAHAIYAREVAAGNNDGAKIRQAFVNELKGKDGGSITQGTAQVFYHKCRKALGLTKDRPRVAKSVEAPAVIEPVAENDSTETVVTTDEPVAEAA